MRPNNISQITPDGSTRCFYRQMRHGKSFIVMEPGESPGGIAEAESYVHIGRHLYKKGIPVPRIYEFDSNTGTVTMEDRGDIHLQTIALQYMKADNTQLIQAIYEKVIDLLITMQFEGIKGFQSTWCFDTPIYDADFAFQREAMYFVDAFACDLAGIDPKQKDELIDELRTLCLFLKDSTGPVCLLHRDFQSRNILWYKDAPWLIDFQGARAGPPFYDLASLLLDPYMQLPEDIIKKLFAFYMETVRAKTGYMNDSYTEINHTFNSYGMMRLIQAVAAYSFLWRKKGKVHFRRYIEPAIDRLLWLLKCETVEFPTLKTILKNGLSEIKTHNS